MRIAYFSPLNPMRSGISDYSEELLPHLAEAAEIELYVDGYEPSSPEIRERFIVRNAREFAGPWGRRRYDICLYHMGNNIRYHEHIYHTLRRYPGVTVLHDSIIHSFVSGATAGRGSPPRYVREMGYAYGERGLRLARLAWSGQRLYGPADYPLVRRVADLSLGVIVHSESARQTVAAARPDVPIQRVNLHAGPEPKLVGRETARRRLGLSADSFVLASFGYVAATKRLEPALRAYRRFRQQVPDSSYLVVGEPVDGYDIEAVVAELGLENHVRLMGFVALDRFWDCVAAADLCLNLRYPTSGEMSHSLMRLMRAGKPVLVSDVDAFVELPDDACAKVSAGPGEEEAILTQLSFLAESPSVRARMGAEARAYAIGECSVEKAAGEYMAFIERVLAGLWTDYGAGDGE